MEAASKLNTAMPSSAHAWKTGWVARVGGGGGGARAVEQLEHALGGVVVVGCRPGGRRAGRAPSIHQALQRCQHPTIHPLPSAPFSLRLQCSP